MFIIRIYYSRFALPKKHRFATDIMIKISMLIRTDMIGLDICKNPYIKVDAKRPVKHQALAADLHHDRITAAVGYITQQFLKHGRIGHRKR